MTPDQFDQLIKLAGEAGTFLYAQALQQAYIELFLNLTWIVIEIILLFLCIRNTNINSKTEWEHADTAFNRKHFMTIVYGVLTVVCGVSLLVDLSILHNYINPSYHALQLLADLVK